MNAGYADTISTGSYEDSLCATRDVIARQIDEGVLARDLASLTRRLLDIQRELKDIEEMRGEGRTETPAERAARMRDERRERAREEYDEDERD